MHQATSALPELTAQGLSSANLTPKAPQFFLRRFVRVYLAHVYLARLYMYQYLYKCVGVVSARGPLTRQRFFESFSLLSTLSFSFLSFSIRFARHGLSILALLMCSVAAHASEFKIFSLQHRFASDLVPVVSPMVSEPGTVSAINNQLIVRTDSATMRAVEAIVERLDIARVNRKVSFKFNQDTQSQYANTEASGNVRVGKVTIGNNRRASPNSGRVDIERHSTQQQRNSSQFLNVLDGENAFIRVGQQVPYTQEWVTYTRRYTQVQTTTDWQDISTGFAVRPNTLGNQVELVITPRISSLNGQTIDFAELNTVVRVNLGEWVNLGGTLQQNDEVSRKILGIASHQSTDNRDFWVKVD